ncbi:MAG: 4-hydroxy-3-methylbut-2-enyl diphosphate reductase, partial [Nanoarchaeota archaeon]
MEVKIATNAGTCFGVENAIKKALDAVNNCKESVYILGEIVHNPIVVKKLKDSGVKEINDIKNIKEEAKLIIRAHGEPKSVYDYCNEKNIGIIDCTCPFVKKAQQIASNLEKEGHQVVIIGDPEHPEVRGILARTNSAFAVNCPEDVEKRKIKYGKLGILSQTTQT